MILSIAEHTTAASNYKSASSIMHQNQIQVYNAMQINHDSDDNVLQY